MFATWDGNTRSPNAMSKEWRRAVHAAKLKATFHSTFSILAFARQLGQQLAHIDRQQSYKDEPLKSDGRLLLIGWLQL